MTSTAIEYISYALPVLLLIYARQILFFFRGLGRLRKGTNEHLHRFTVLISARNEEHNIERCLRSLMRQEYPVDKLFIIVIDDQSTDRTAEIVRTIAADSPFSLLLLHSNETSNIRSPKIRALAAGMQHASGEIIVTTDADCVAPSTWIASLNSYFEPDVGLVSGMTVYERSAHIPSLFWGIQYLDFLSYCAVGAGAIGMGRVVTSQGSNTAFRRIAFDQCGGFSSVAHINSGTDSLLAQKIVAGGQWSPRFAYDHSATMTTQAMATWRDAFQQRVRWVGQTAYYPPYLMFFMICTFIMFVGLFITIPLTAVSPNPIPWLVLAGLNVIDFMTMYRFTRITGTAEMMKYYLPTAVIHIPFILFSTIGGYFFSYRWKERKLRITSAEG